MQCVHEALEREDESTRVSVLLAWPALLAQLLDSPAPPAPWASVKCLSETQGPNTGSFCPNPPLYLCGDRAAATAEPGNLWAPPTTGPRRLCDLLSRPQIVTHTTA